MCGYVWARESVLNGAKNPQSCHARRAKLSHFPTFSTFPTPLPYLYVCVCVCECRAQIAQVQENNYILRVPINLAEFLVSVLVLPTNSLAFHPFLPPCWTFLHPFSNSIFLVEFAFYFSSVFPPIFTRNSLAVQWQTALKWVILRGSFPGRRSSHGLGKNNIEHIRRGVIVPGNHLAGSQNEINLPMANEKFTKSFSPMTSHGFR